MRDRTNYDGADLAHEETIRAAQYQHELNREARALTATATPHELELLARHGRTREIRRAAREALEATR